MGFLASADDTIRAAIARAMEPPPPPDITRWAEENVVFDARSPLPGPFDASRFPFVREIHAVLSPEHPCREVTLRGSAQWGKTESIIQPTVGAWHEYGPLDSLVVFPTIASAKTWVRRKWLPLRRSAPALRRLFGAGSDNADTLFDQETLDTLGSLKVTSAGSPSDLTGTSRRLIVKDDLSDFEDVPEGDPDAMADARAEAFEEAKILNVGVPRIKGTCRITAKLERSDFRLYHVPCPHCGHMQPLEWENMVASLTPETVATAHFTCRSCGAAIEHRHKAEIVAKGRWVATNPGGDHPGFHLWRAYAPQRDWASIARRYAQVMGWSSVTTTADTAALKADANPLTDQTFHNEYLGLPFEQATGAPDWQKLRDRAEHCDDDQRLPAGTVPFGYGLLVAGADCQADRIEVQIRAYGRNLRSCTVAYIVIPHEIASVAGRAALDALLKQTWPTASGQRQPLDLLAIDEGNWQEEVRDWAYRYPYSRVITVRGARSQTGPAYQPMQTRRRRDGTLKKVPAKQSYLVNVSMLKGEFYGRLRVEDPAARGHVAFTAGLGDEYFRQLCSEVRRITRNAAGVATSAWVPVPGVRNEALDTAIYAEVAALRKGWRALTDAQWDALEEKWGAPAPVPQGDLFDAPPAPASRPSPAARRRNLVERLP